MSIFGHNCGTWRNYGPAGGGSQQQVCKHGRVRTIRVKPGLFHSHSWPVGKRGRVVQCNGCTTTRRL